MSVLQAVLEKDGIHLPKGGGANKSIKCFMPGHDDDSPSMSVNVAKDVFFCHGCKAKGNAYTYLTEVRGCTKKEALEILESHGATQANLSHYQAKDSENKAERTRARKGQPRHVKAPYTTHSKGFTLSATYHYYRRDDPEHEHPIIVQRWDGTVKDGKTGEYKAKKDIYTFVPAGKGGFWNTAPDNEGLPDEDRVSPIPLYGIEEVMPRVKTSQVWIVEGEKCRDAVAAIKTKTPPPCVSPYGGSNKPLRNDWSPLYGQRVLLIADADKAGRRFMKTIGKHLAQNDTTVRYFLPKGDTGYDIFDALQEDDWTSMMAWINEHGGVQNHEDVHPPSSQDDVGEIEIPPLDDCQHFTVLGYEGDDVIIQNKRTHYMHRMRIASLTSEGQLIHLAPLEFWRSLAPNGQLTSRIKAMWADKIIRAAELKGAITTGNMKLYELGAAITEHGEVVYNVGDQLMTEDARGLLTITRPLLFSGQGREIYLPGPKIRMLDHPDAAKWAGEMASAVLRYRWESAEDARSFLGWIVASITGGALGFRPMIWMLGGAGTGKTFLLDEVLKKLMGTLLTDVGSGSEAGLAAMSGNASLPFYIDEFEPEKAKEAAITQILSLMRIASSGGQARVRSTASGGKIIRRPRFSLLVSSINMPNLDSASQSRIVTIKLSETPVADWPDVRDSIYGSLTNERALAIRTYIIRNTARVVRKAKQLEDKMIERNIDTRTAKTRAALAAGYSLLSGKETEVAMKKREEANNLAPLMAMMSKMIKVDHRERVLAECLYSAYYTEDGRWIGIGAAAGDEQKALQKICWQHGFGFIEENKLYIALNYYNTRRLLQQTQYENIDVDGYIQNLPGVVRRKTKSGNDKRKRIVDGVQKPVALIPDEIKEKIGFTQNSDDYESDTYIKEEDLPF